MSVQLYEGPTSDTPFTSNSSFFRALKFQYMDEARTVNKRVWLRNEGDETTDGYVYVNNLEPVIETAPPVLGFDPVAEDDFSTNRTLSDTVDAFGWSCFVGWTPLPYVNSGVLKFNSGFISFAGRQMYGTLTYVSAISPVRTYRWKLKSGAYLSDVGSITVGKHNGDPAYGGVNVTGGRGLIVRNLGGGLWSLQGASSSSGNFPPSGATAWGFTSASGSEAYIRSLIDGAVIDMTVDTHVIWPGGFSVDRFTYEITLSDGYVILADEVYHNQNGMNGVYTAATFNSFAVDYWGYGDPTEEPGEETIIGYEGQDTWFRFAEDLGGTPGAWDRENYFSLEPGEQKPIWIKLTVPLSSSPDVKVDFRVKATYS